MTEEKTLLVNETPVVEVLNQDILYIKGIIPWSDDLVEACKDSELWYDSPEFKPGEFDNKVTERRTSQQLMVNKGAGDVSAFEMAIFSAVGLGLAKYIDHNEYFSITDDAGYAIIRYETGQFYKEHIDSSTSKDVGRARSLSILLYLNDDYEGGELYFPRQDIKIKPEAGSMIVFPSLGTHPHEALEVTKGTKYVVVTWAR